MTAAACICNWDSRHEHLILIHKECVIHGEGLITKKELDKIEFPSGAVRGSDEIRYDLVPKEMIVRTIPSFLEGEVKYGKFNYRKGIPVMNLLNHAINHLLDYQDWLNQGDSREKPSEDHIGHALANLGMLCWMEANKHDAS